MAGIAALTMNIFLPSLNPMADYFDTEYRIMQRSISLYLGVNALLQILIGPISDRFGRRPVMLWAIALFVVATAGTLLAPNIYVFLVFRSLQSIIVAGLVLSRAAVRDMFPQEQAASMIGYVTMGMAIVPMIGPAIGGYLEEAYSWQASFLLLLVLGIAVFTLAWADMGETSTTRSANFKDQFRQYPELLKSPRFWGYCASAAFGSGTFFAYLGGAPYVGSEVFELTPKHLGYYLGAPAFGYAFGNYLSGRYSVRMGINRMILFGALSAFLGLLVLVFLQYMGLVTPVVFFGLFITVGIGNGLLLPNATVGMLSVRPHLAGSASGLGGAIMIGGGAILSDFSGKVLTPGSGPMPLLIIMIISGLASLLAIMYVMWRTNKTHVA